MVGYFTTYYLALYQRKAYYEEPDNNILRTTFAITRTKTLTDYKEPVGLQL